MRMETFLLAGVTFMAGCGRVLCSFLGHDAVFLKPVHCLLDDVLHPFFSSSAGNYDPGRVSVEVCSETCRKLKYTWAGLTEGKYCLCTSQAGFPGSRKNRGTCNLKCPTGSADSPCGGRNGEISVYKAADSGVDVEGVRSFHDARDRGIRTRSQSRQTGGGGYDAEDFSIVTLGKSPLVLGGSGGRRLFDEL